MSFRMIFLLGNNDFINDKDKIIAFLKVIIFN